MKVLLINPKYPYPGNSAYTRYNRVWVPLSLANCAGLLREDGHEVRIIDAHAKRLDISDLSKYIKSADKIFITSSTLDKWQCPDIDLGPFEKALVELTASHTRVYVMGYHGSVAPERIFKIAPLIKGIVRGEPEQTVLEICAEKNPDKIVGFSYKDKQERIIHNADRDFSNLDDISKPSWDLIDFKDYEYEVLGKNFALFELSRGCVYNCSFCNDAMYGKKFRKKSWDSAKAQLADLLENNNVKNLYFIDLLFTFDRALVLKLCDFLIEKNYDFSWCCQTRTDLVDEELLKKMKQAGCSLIHFGVESAARNVLKNMRKNLDHDKTAEAVSLCKKTGIRTVCFFILGMDNETQEDRQATFKLAKKLNPTYVVYRLFLNFREIIEGENKNYFHDRGYGLIQKQIKTEYYSFYLNPGRILSRMGSNSIPRLCRQAVSFYRLIVSR